ncbi:hypothetical protein GLOIN_2v1576135 [Rhizophagus irregularis DAOM 181602=DAOM 197198]|uniref:Uncharacterized protein n=1 Tax=Rhizophagus irregularis (strain DAOM 181602 / DAOM 197198 / MUCL 43194) TaxID=747089 RepID=A0A2P4QA28_RHIID|nr:hypothetical protein GLOIN_2v1576135 [Rhizophagus irregularis DAOM 181602=DAOM 197198]POG74482.1 hypothetical protein GLOIN_2v1576135 [Rhizophagus irregularis DAOM 181602=DAOM 197198]GET61291.1 hypothetical protein GLOIN_2v1576135 [Rhizophagus irregularis DAOM 181602=DAOM 197198]|eukprot:XP_025181348.1 hypothetical protein GLOIN_2v1576135 [Rhizophagus irregularis DAOM 181602=DAOM 197198]
MKVLPSKVAFFTFEVFLLILASLIGSTMILEASFSSTFKGLLVFLNFTGSNTTSVPFLLSSSTFCFFFDRTV